jgi:hypothetical protein
MPPDPFVIVYSPPPMTLHKNKILCWTLGVYLPYSCIKVRWHDVTLFYLSYIHSYMLTFTHPAFAKTKCKYRARIVKLLRSPGINSKASIPPAYVAWRASTRYPYSYSVRSPHRLSKNSSTGYFMGI